jgi:hypothetical protein
MGDETDGPLEGGKHGSGQGEMAGEMAGRAPVRPPATVSESGSGAHGPAPPRSEAVPPALPRAERAFVMAGPSGSVNENTDARPAALLAVGEASSGDELARRRARDETARRRARAEALEQENRELWAMLIEERRERMREHERMSRLVELARRNPPAPEGR